MLRDGKVLLYFGNRSEVHRNREDSIPPDFFVIFFHAIQSVFFSSGKTRIEDM